MVFIESNVDEMVYMLVLYLNQNDLQLYKRSNHNCCYAIYLSAISFQVRIRAVTAPLHFNEPFPGKVLCYVKTPGNYLYSNTPDEATIQTEGVEPGPCVPIQPRHLINYYPIKKLPTKKLDCRFDLPQQHQAC